MPLNISLGISSCPNDTFIFHALLHGLVRPEYRDGVAINLHMADVEELNKLALSGKLEISKISVGVLPWILDNYIVISSGAALGFGCGPLVVAKNAITDFAYAKVAAPGRMTTANLLLDLHGGFCGERKQMLFSDIMPALVNDEADLGVIIHEGRFTYQNMGLHKILDLGEWWEDKYHLPLPLGAIVIRRDVANELATAMEKAIAQSVEYAWKHPDASLDFIRSNAREISREVTDSHIKTFVTQFSKNLGDEGRNAIEVLVKCALAKNGKNMDMDIFLE